MLCINGINYDLITTHRKSPLLKTFAWSNQRIIWYIKWRFTVKLEYQWTISILKHVILNAINLYLQFTFNLNGIWSLLSFSLSQSLVCAWRVGSVFLSLDSFFITHFQFEYFRLSHTLKLARPPHFNFRPTSTHTSTARSDDKFIVCGFFSPKLVGITWKTFINCQNE